MEQQGIKCKRMETQQRRKVGTSEIKYTMGRRHFQKPAGVEIEITGR